MVPNGLLADVAVEVTRRLDSERWAVAEERTAELITRIQPTPASENRRRAVADYVQRLIMGCLSCQVVAFGSFPLKTYLPDGDIDVTAFSNSEELKNTWAVTVRDALEHEEKSEKAEFRVIEVQYIQAEVKIIKCLVENIAVDISFNQVGGLCTLCFLEEMDHLINQNHLFKRSIILIKVWCYYESRILGAHHGLISTYALETLVLYIFHVFSNSFAGPLEVLYRFLEFFSNFDWEKFCVSLWGPVPISSLPEMAADPPRKDGGALLLSKSFLDICSSIYAVLPSPHDNQVQPFVSKYFNIIDPLRANNNLGRSVSKGNFFRIRSAFAFGAKRLARLLECPKEDLATEVKQFFTNTWRRHGNGNRPDAPAQSLIHQTVKVVPVEVPSSHRNTMAHKKKFEVPTTHIGHDSFTEDTQNMAFQNFGSLDDAHLPDANITTPPVSVVADHDNKSDILNSDFLSHWQNLQYGRFCQNARPPAPVLYPVAMPPMYLPGHFPLNGPATQPAHSFNWAQVRSRGQGVVPLTPLHTSERASGFQRHGEDAPRYRGGTGTYLPTPKVPFKDRQSGSRSYRRSCNSERVDHNDKEGSWVNSKQRNMGRSQSEQSGVRHDTQTSDENESERHWQPYRSDSHRREAGGPSSVQSHSFENTDSTHDAVNMAYGVPSQPSNVSSGTSASSQPVVMVCSYDQSVDYGAPSKPIEFGSFGAIPMDSSEIKQAHEVHENGFYKQRHAPYKGTSSRLSPDQPSMPHLPRS